mmetsp:Transcript_37305/g.97313  ORF Transcript_37305/g.97313 Transcript_37305/m.97313 type:complete len:283 (+) Transcript_37305:879-1727(+)
MQLQHPVASVDDAELHEVARDHLWSLVVPRDVPHGAWLLAQTDAESVDAELLRQNGVGVLLVKAVALHDRGRGEHRPQPDDGGPLGLEQQGHAGVPHLPEGRVLHIPRPDRHVVVGLHAQKLAAAVRQDQVQVAAHVGRALVRVEESRLGPTPVLALVRHHDKLDGATVKHSIHLLRADLQSGKVLQVVGVGHGLPVVHRRVGQGTAVPPQCRRGRAGEHRVCGVAPVEADGGRAAGPPAQERPCGQHARVNHGLPTEHRPIYGSAGAMQVWPKDHLEPITA